MLKTTEDILFGIITIFPDMFGLKILYFITLVQLVAEVLPSGKYCRNVRT